ncbi:MAG: phosphoglycolate phosphatase [Arenimonas sp. SCN 70-307]|uniref:phosphoglycolate phosphatase n=1 Tax=Arenimonas sp. SCN 70-307 TaxID=1660089 RepID=UPI000869638A|nr:phosphoglycolate phosphatase [Arenimonas sp. SCN 70-307]ODS64894.1 MAG: phosphoglycolate phosphatase [Arenimonas sp. SCN 70-307]
MGQPPVAVLFDLDGTLVDSAPDLARAANRVLADHGRPPVDYARLRAVVSKGGRAMLAVSFPDFDEAAREALLPVFLRYYGEGLADESVIFDGVDSLLAALDARGVRWGIVTNKPEGLARGVVEGFGWRTRCAVLVGGDTLATRKPDPGTLLHACAQLGIAPGDALYVGDDLRDIEAARAAGMPSVAALWGYREDGDDPHRWGADRVAAHASEVLEWLP